MVLESKQQEQNNMSELPFSSACTIKANKLAVAFFPSAGSNAFPPLLLIGWRISKKEEREREEKLNDCLKL